MMKRARAWWCVLTPGLLLYPSLVMGQGQEIHGGDSVFSGQGVAIVWGVLKGAVEEQTEVIIRVAPLGQAYTYISVEAVDPFSRERRVVLPGRPLAGQLDVRSLRSTFADFPRREIRFYRTADDWRSGKPVLTVYYLGVPDTTPEFTSEAALFAYLAAALAGIKGKGRIPRPSP